MSQIDRNRWSEKETDQLMNNVVKLGSSKGSKETARVLGRTEKACEQRYYIMKKKSKQQKNQPITKQMSTTSKTSIIVHNGTSKTAEILVSKDNLIVARCGDLVITIEK
jgi:hypothetical protein